MPRKRVVDDGRPSEPASPARMEATARDTVLRSLTVRARTRQELERALRAKNIPEEIGVAVLDRMSEVGLVDDAQFAVDWVSSRQQRRHLSRNALQRELSTRGVARETIDGALEPVGSEQEYTAACALAERRFATMGGLARDVCYRRLAGALARRGFGAEVTGRVLRRVLAGGERDVSGPDGE